MKICNFLAVSITTIFGLYASSILKTVPCGKDVMTKFYRNFVHLEPFHLLGNLLGLYSLTRVETALGTKKFIKLISFLIIFNTIFESVLHKVRPDTKCSIGFSGVLFGLITWERIYYKKFDIPAILSLIFMIAMPSFTISNASLSGHIIGSIGGIISGLLWAKFN